MRIRSLVPALACLAAAPIAFAADSMPAVKIDGFVDSIYSITNTENAGATTGFTYAGKLGLTATISEKVAAQVDLNLSGTSGDSGASTNAITSRQTYGTWKLTDEVVLKTGKFINDIGWTAAYSPGLYRINGGPITSFYGVDQVGAHARYAKGELAASVAVANGLFGEANGATAQTTNQDNEAYALVLDAVYTRDAGSFNVELGFDEDVGTGGTDGDGHHLGLNATLTPNKELTIGAELILQAVNNKGGNEDTAHLGATVLANFKLAGSKIRCRSPASCRTSMSKRT